MGKPRGGRKKQPVEDLTSELPALPRTPSQDRGHDHAEEQGSLGDSAVRSFAEWAVVALPPTTLLTALAFWFGYVFTAARVDYLGIDVSTLGFSTADYLVRSIDALIVPAIVLLVVWLLVLGMHAVLWPVVVARPRTRTAGAGLVALTVLGVVAMALSLRFVFVALPAEVYLLPPVLLGAGSLCAAYGVRGMGAARQHRGMPARSGVPGAPGKGARTIFTALVVISLFWGTSLYAGALGRGRAMSLEHHLTSRPSVTVYSKASLSLAPPVRESRITTPEAEYRFVYTGLRLVIRANGKYFLLPEKWVHGTGAAIVLQESSDIRFEFRSGEP